MMWGMWLHARVQRGDVHLELVDRGGGGFAEGAHFPRSGFLWLHVVPVEDRRSHDRMFAAPVVRGPAKPVKGGGQGDEPGDRMASRDGHDTSSDQKVCASARFSI